MTAGAELEGFKLCVPLLTFSCIPDCMLCSDGHTIFALQHQEAAIAADLNFHFSCLKISVNKVGHSPNLLSHVFMGVCALTIQHTNLAAQ